jgi:nucleoside-diphosphate-sugar epimerase
MTRYVIVGAGPVGRETAQLLLARGDEVTVVTRSGTGPDLPGVDRLALDATDADRLARAASGAAALFNCANPPSYTVWDQVWPPLAAGLLTAAERSGATLVTASSLYAYGPVPAPMVEGQPDRATDHKGRLRADMWAAAKSSHDAGRCRAVEVRASDYVGPGVGANGHIPRHVAAGKRGRTAWVMGSPDQPHTWTDVLDMARALVAAADRPESWGRVWHAPSNAPRTQREALTEVLAAAGCPAVPVRSFPRLVTALGARLSPLMRELTELEYIFTRPYVMDSRASQEALGLAPTEWAEVCRRTAAGN